ncbi:MAG: hypothetical protein JNK51_00335 [Blastocatellia bacterium]|nr:hypothetical protein [Chloracidobacterium sp.]MBL8183348.1 hypothetical protein [Blastocatellia bacterium]HRJ90479.1 hypothetical protein [Pyrinomonadaceae bacterium]HRK51745.1 hypothetical protein [Pyrinomonadaceae bacterium]
MRPNSKEIAVIFAIAVLLFAASCGGSADSGNAIASVDANTTEAEPPKSFVPPPAEPEFPDLQAEIKDGRFAATSSPIGSFDFRNHTYPLPRGWHNPDGTDEIRLENGRLEPIAGTVSDDMSDTEKAEARSQRRIGLSYVSTRFFDATGDGQDDAVVILKIETAGNAIPQLAYIFEWKDEKPELIWHFRTGDRADGGLKDIRVEDGALAIELFGQDRFMLGSIETGKITGDEEQLCCPTHFTRSFYKWNGKNFLRQGKRLTYLTTDPTAPPVENMGDVVNAKKPPAKKR